MISLFVDTSYKSLFVGIINNDFLVDKINIMSEANFSETLVPSIYEIMKKNNLSINSIDKLFVVVGPGSFTGIRIGLTVSKILGFALNKKIIPISSLEFMATTKTTTSYKIPFIDARRGYTFAGVYDADGNSVFPDSYCLLDDLIKRIDGDITFISYDNIDGYKSIKPDYDVISIVNKHINDKELSPHEIKPIYLKRTEAEEKLS